jgi:hypothetical protein
VIVDLEQLIKLSKTVAKPYVIAVGILSALLLLSVCGNIYMATKKQNITIEQENIESDFNNNGIIE